MGEKEEGGDEDKERESSVVTFSLLSIIAPSTVSLPRGCVNLKIYTCLLCFVHVRWCSSG